MKQKTFDIIVMTQGEDGQPPLQKTVNGVKASSAQELINLYGMTGEKVKIIREYDGEDTSTSTPAISSDTSKQPIVQQSFIQPKPIKQKTPPKYFTVGGIECKVEDGKVYQKQWIRIDNDQLNSFRIISDSSNKIIPLTGKHIEQKKWVLISNEDEEVTE